MPQSVTAHASVTAAAAATTATTAAAATAAARTSDSCHPQVNSDGYFYDPDTSPDEAEEDDNKHDVSRTGPSDPTKLLPRSSSSSFGDPGALTYSLSSFLASSNGGSIAAAAAAAAVASGRNVDLSRRGVPAGGPGDGASDAFVIPGSHSNSGNKARLSSAGVNDNNPSNDVLTEMKHLHSFEQEQQQKQDRRRHRHRHRHRAPIVWSPPEPVKGAYCRLKCTVLQLGAKYDGWLQLDEHNLYFSGHRRALGLLASGPSPGITVSNEEDILRPRSRSRSASTSPHHAEETSSPSSSTSSTSTTAAVAGAAPGGGGVSTSSSSALSVGGSAPLPDIHHTSSVGPHDHVKYEKSPRIVRQLSTSEYAVQQLNLPSPAPLLSLVIPIASIQFALPRSYWRLPIGLEVFCFLRPPSESVYLLFDNHDPLLVALQLRKQLQRERDTVLHLLRKVIRHAPDATPLDNLRSVDAVTRWLSGRMSTFTYLSLINVVAGRSYHDITMYPIFPLVLLPSLSQSPALNEARVYRDLRVPVHVLANRAFTGVTPLANSGGAASAMFPSTKTSSLALSSLPAGGTWEKEYDAHARTDETKTERKSHSHVPDSPFETDGFVDVAGTLRATEVDTLRRVAAGEPNVFPPTYVSSPALVAAIGLRRPAMARAYLELNDGFVDPQSVIMSIDSLLRKALTSPGKSTVVQTSAALRGHGCTCR